MDCQLVRAVPGESVANEPVASAGGHSEQSFQPVRYLRQRAVVREPWAGVVRSRIQFIYVLSEVYFGGKQRGAAVWRAQREIRMGLPEYEGRRRGTEQFLHAALRDRSGFHEVRSHHFGLESPHALVRADSTRQSGLFLVHL